MTRCILPHKFQSFEIPETNNMLKTCDCICDSHARFSFGLEERSVSVAPNWFLRKYTGLSNPVGIRSPVFFAAQSFRYNNECNNIVFKEGEYVLFTNEHAKNEVQKYSTLDLRNPTTKFINTPLTKFLRQFTVNSNIVPDTKVWNTYQANFNQLHAAQKDLTLSNAVMDALFTFITHWFEPFSNKINIQRDFNNAYLNRIAAECKKNHMRLEPFRDELYEQYNTFYDEQDANTWSGLHWAFLNAIDIPVGPDYRVTEDIGLNGCPKQNTDNQKIDHHYRNSIHIPNIVADMPRGYKATRDIYDGEELVLEPRAHKYQQQSCWVRTHYSVVKPWSENKKIAEIQAPNTLTIPQIYTRNMSIQGSTSQLWA